MTTAETRDRRIAVADRRINLLHAKRVNYQARIDRLSRELAVVEERREWLAQMPISSNGVVHGDGAGSPA